MSACPSHETLVSLWAGELDAAEAATVDEHAFACGPCAAAMEGLAKVVGALREKIPYVISHAHRDRLAAAGTRIRVTEVEPTLDPAERKSAQFAADVDLLVFALRGDVSGADRVDVEIASPTGEPRVVLEDVPFDRETGEVLIACQRHFEGMFPAGDPIFSVHAVEAGERRSVGDYVVTHLWR
jgi:anti-sigma factor ChrR (cupin superfamily)